MKSTFQNEAKIHFLALAALFSVTVGFTSQVFGAKPTFRSYNLKSNYGQILFFDFDGDGLDDIIVNNEPNLVFFFQSPKSGFTKAPNLVYSLGEKPSVSKLS